ncbi:MAG: DUF2281 domain-containing protein [Methanolinea sp.]|jgi:hypothetical protein|nr:DUF2281 domain-containing protein [Methanolinea sp.]
MTGIEEKISKLTPELQREVEDYIDFLLKRHSPPAEQERIPEFFSPSPPKTSSSSIILADEISFRREQDILPGYKDLGQVADLEGPTDVVKAPPVRVRKSQATEPGRKLLDWID